ncbi:MAG: NAD-binding protein [Deltaproteobacteria bacterium]|nr:NAD-binding protein [Deltaproteobacteria bacterium]
MDDVRDRDHVVICGWNENGLELINNMQFDFKPRIPVMVLVNELTREDVDAIIYRFPEISFRYVRGNFTKEEILARANIKKARAAVVLADIASGHPLEKADERTIFACLAIKSMAPKVKTCAELRNSENREHLKRAKVDEIVVRGEYNAAILAGAAANTGLSVIMKKMMDVDEPNKLWRIKVPEKYIGRTVGELSEHIHQKYCGLLLALTTETSPMRLEDILSTDATAIDAFIKRKFEESGKDFFSGGKARVSTQLNPSRDYVLTKHDYAIVISATRPVDVSILDKSIVDLVTETVRAEVK